MNSEEESDYQSDTKEVEECDKIQELPPKKVTDSRQRFIVS